MPARILSAALHGIEAIPVDVEVDVLAGLPSFTVVGLTDKSIQESRERMTAALSNISYTPPRRKTIVSLAPASLRKEGSLYDLPITIGFLVASEQVNLHPDKLEQAWFIGEIGLDGTIRSVPGVLPIVMAAARYGIRDIYIPADNANESSPLADQINIYPVNSLQELLTHLAAKPESGSAGSLAPLSVSAYKTGVVAAELDMSEIKGQEHAKRALAICAAGNHNVLLTGPPGTGKTLLAQALIGILPPLQPQEALTVTCLYSIAGQLSADQGLVTQRPFRSPHHGASSVALVGGGANPRPGEVSLAHQGVLFLDEMPEFSRSVLEQLRQPIEDGFVTVSRAAQTVRFPARSMVVGAMNPCPCGFIGSDRKDCICTPSDVLRYQRRISGPLLDRFDLHVLVNDVPVEELLSEERQGMTSAEYAQLIAAARARAWQRQGKNNAELTAGEIREYCHLDETSKKLLVQAQEKFRLSARGIHRLLKVALTIADLAGDAGLQQKHLAEALQYREQLKAALPDFA